MRGPSIIQDGDPVPGVPVFIFQLEIVLIRGLDLPVQSANTPEVSLHAPTFPALAPTTKAAVSSESSSSSTSKSPYSSSYTPPSNYAAVYGALAAADRAALREAREKSLREREDHIGQSRLSFSDP